MPVAGKCSSHCWSTGSYCRNFCTVIALQWQCRCMQSTISMLRSSMLPARPSFRTYGHYGFNTTHPVAAYMP